MCKWDTVWPRWCAGRNPGIEPARGPSGKARTHFGTLVNCHHIFMILICLLRQFVLEGYDIYVLFDIYIYLLFFFFFFFFFFASHLLSRVSIGRCFPCWAL